MAKIRDGCGWRARGGASMTKSAPLPVPRRPWQDFLRNCAPAGSIPPMPLAIASSPAGPGTPSIAWWITPSCRIFGKPCPLPPCICQQPLPALMPAKRCGPISPKWPVSILLSIAASQSLPLASPYPAIFGTKVCASMDFMVFPTNSSKANSPIGVRPPPLLPIWVMVPAWPPFPMVAVRIPPWG